MSFKLFLASTFGLIKSTDKFEAAYEKLLADYRMFCEFEQSEAHKEYHELEHLVQSEAFRNAKKELQHLSLKGSKEETQLKELKRLSGDRRIKRFYSMLNSEELQRFDRIGTSEQMSKYKTLKAAVEKHSLEALKQKDKNSVEYALYLDYQNIRNSEEIKSFKKFRLSAGYLNYELMLDSPERKQLEELRKTTLSDEFKARVEYLEDKAKWEKTPESQKEKRFAEMQKLQEVVNYLKYKQSDAFDFFRKWELVFEDRFDTGKLDPEKWMTRSHWANEALGQNFSQLGDFHAFTDGKNVSVVGKSLKIEVRREKTNGMQWQIPFGFVEKEFEYSSGIVSTTGNHWWKNGRLEAKVRYAPNQSFVDAIYLLGEESSPQVNLIEMGAKNRLGLLTKSTDGIHAECESISGLKNGEFYIFSLEWTAQNLTWAINGREILQISNQVPSLKMHINAASIVAKEPSTGLPHQFEIDWIRFYQQKK
jgi:beta-glucanase (GH16 family)